jgi:hypothetical protein
MEYFRELGHSGMLQLLLFALLTGTSGWGMVQWFLDRRIRKTKAEESKANHLKLLSEVQATAQTVALESANERYSGLHTDYKACHDGLVHLRGATEKLITAIDELVMWPAHYAQGDETITITLTVVEFQHIRQIVRDARNELI